MKKNKKKQTRSPIFLLVALGVMLFLPAIVKADIVSGGLWVSYERDNKAEKVYVENLDFGIGEFEAILASRFGSYPDDIDMAIEGFVYAEIEGTYHFRFDTNSNTICMLIVDNHYDKNCRYTDQEFNEYMKVGWNRVSLYYATRSYSDPQLQMFWTPPGPGGVEEIVPTENLASHSGSNDMVQVPATGKEKFNFVAAGVAGEYTEAPEIIIDVPNPVPTDLPDDYWMKDDAHLFWLRKTGDPNALKITNARTGVGVDEPAIRIRSVFDKYYYDLMYTHIPHEVLDGNPDSTLHLRFEKVAGATDPFFVDGLSLILPYLDDSRPEGRLLLKMGNINAYHAISPITYFPIDGSKDGTIDPYFLMNNGETKITSADSPPTYRPNYAYWMSGTDSEKPGRPYVLKDDPRAHFLFPETMRLNRSNPDTFYPTYGREGEQLDVLSSNYVPNLWGPSQAQYINQEEGKVDPITVDPTHTWIGFQYTGSNFDGDGVNGSGESGSMAVVGVYTTEELAMYDVDVSVMGDGRVESDLPGISCPGDCSGYYDDGTFLTLTAAPNGSSTFLGWGGDCAGAGTNLACCLFVDRSQNVIANFDGSSGPIDGICGEACNQTNCLQPTSGFCTSPSNLQDPPGVQENATGWGWVCEGFNGGSDANCQAERQCGWTER